MSERTRKQLRQMFEAQKATQLPRNFVGDIELDYHEVERHAPKGFVWMLRENGTQYQALDADDNESIRDVQQYLRLMQKTFGYSEHRWYVWGKSEGLEEITYQDLMAWLRYRADYNSYQEDKGGQA
jgi:hypothetical protein